MYGSEICERKDKDNIYHGISFQKIGEFLVFSGLCSEVYSEPCETSKMDHFAKIVKG